MNDIESSVKSNQEPNVSSQAAEPEASVAPSGRREAFRNVRRQLTEDELSGRGVQKLILEELDRAESQCDILQGYVERYYEADKRAAVLEEQVKTERAVEVLFAIGLGLGGAILGLTPFFWTNRLQGLLSLGVGMVLILGSVIARVRR